MRSSSTNMKEFFDESCCARVNQARILKSPEVARTLSFTLNLVCKFITTWTFVTFSNESQKDCKAVLERIRVFQITHKRLSTYSLRTHFLRLSRILIHLSTFNSLQLTPTNAMLSMIQTKTLLLTSLLLFITCARSLCTLCETIYDIPERWDFILEIDPVLTCKDVYFSLITLNAASNECIDRKSKYQLACCDDEEPNPNDFPTFPPASKTPVGFEPDCLLCGTL